MTMATTECRPSHRRNLLLRLHIKVLVSFEQSSVFRAPCVSLFGTSAWIQIIANNTWLIVNFVCGLCRMHFPAIGDFYKSLLFLLPFASGEYLLALIMSVSTNQSSVSKEYL